MRFELFGMLFFSKNGEKDNFFWPKFDLITAEFENGRNNKNEYAY